MLLTNIKDFYIPENNVTYIKDSKGTDYLLKIVSRFDRDSDKTIDTVGSDGEEFAYDVVVRKHVGYDEQGNFINEWQNVVIYEDLTIYDLLNFTPSFYVGRTTPSEYKWSELSEDKQFNANLTHGVVSLVKNNVPCFKDVEETVDSWRETPNRCKYCGSSNIEDESGLDWRDYNEYAEVHQKCNNCYNTQYAVFHVEFFHND